MEILLLRQNGCPKGILICVCLFHNSLFVFAKIRKYLGAPGSTFVLLVEKFRESCSQMLPKCCHSSGCKLVLKTKGKFLKKDKKIYKTFTSIKKWLKNYIIKKKWCSQSNFNFVSFYFIIPFLIITLLSMQKLEITLAAPGSTFLRLGERFRERCFQVFPGAPKTLSFFCLYKSIANSR